MPKGQGHFHFALRTFQQLQDCRLRQGLSFNTTLGQPGFELGGTIGILQASYGTGHIHVCPLKLLITLNGSANQSHIQHDARVVDELVQAVIHPLAFLNRKLSEFSLNCDLHVHIADVIDFEALPLIGGIGGIVSEGITVLVLCRSAEIPDQVLAFLQFLLLQAQYSTDTIQGQRQAKGGGPNHRTAPGCRIQVGANRHTQVLRNTDTFKLSIKGPLQNRVILKGGQYRNGEFFPCSQVNNLGRAVVDGISEQ